MSKVYKVVCIAIIVYLFLPVLAFAATAPKTFSGVVTRIYGSQVMFSTTSAAKYAADAGAATLVRKNGASMQFSEIFVGDKIEVKGMLWGDNSISASSIKDLSLYAHKGTFSGKITGINPSSSSFTLQSKAHGDQAIYTNNFTSYTKNGIGSSFKDIELGMTMSVKGVWDRTNTEVVAVFSHSIMIPKRFF